MSDWKRATKEVQFEGLMPEMVDEIKKHIELYNLGPIPADALMCIQTDSEKVKKGLLARRNLANVGIEGLDPGKLADHLWTTRRVFVVGIGHPQCTGIRVTPNVYTTLGEVDLFAEGMEEALAKGMAG